jgi:hypothetical protein
MFYWFQNQIDILIARLAIWSIKQGYGANCEMTDLDDFPEDYKKPKDVFGDSRCASCRAKEVVDWLEKHIKLIKSI